MKHTQFLRTLTLATLLLGGASARADLIQWGYSWEAFPSNVTAGSGSVELIPESYHTVKGDSDVVAANLKVHSTALPASPDVFGASDGNYQLRLHLTDVATSATSYIDFTGKLQGKFSQLNATVTNSFLGTTTQTATIGSTVFTVTLAYYTPPGPPSQGNLGSIGANVQVSPGLRPASVPEPSSLILGGIGLGAFGLTAWKRRRRVPASV